MFERALVSAAFDSANDRDRSETWFKAVFSTKGEFFCILDDREYSPVKSLDAFLSDRSVDCLRWPMARAGTLLGAGVIVLTSSS